MQFYSLPVEEHTEVPLADEGQLEALVSAWSRRRDRAAPATPGQSRCYAVTVGRSAARRAELLGLIEAAGDVVVGHEAARDDMPNPRTWLGRGTCVAIAEHARALGAELLVVDATLTPSQARNLEDVTGLPVQDREGLILEVFRRNARSRKARIQVEIAWLQYLRPRIRGLGLDMDQQTGGIMASRGAGETASELLARQLDDRLVQLRQAFSRLVLSGEQQRARRDGCARVVLVGYTNAGKTSLMNALTGADLSARDRPFETLDATSRCLSRHGGDVLLSDTVGFIRDLPDRLLESFASTLAEVQEASLLAIVVDLSDPEWRLHLDTTHAMLDRLGAGAIRRLYVFNKADRLQAPAPDLDRLVAPHASVVVCAHDAEAVEHLREVLLQQARQDERTASLLVPYEAGDLVAQLHRTCRVLATEATDRGLRLKVAGKSWVVERLLRAWAEVVA